MAKWRHIAIPVTDPRKSEFYINAFGMALLCARLEHIQKIARSEDQDRLTTARTP